MEQLVTVQPLTRNSNEINVKAGALVQLHTSHITVKSKTAAPSVMHIPLTVPRAQHVLLTGLPGQYIAHMNVMLERAAAHE